jgi:hypothetical protein
MRLRARPPPVETPSLHEFSIIPTGVEGGFDGPEWDNQLGPHVRAWMRRVGCVANGDCGPASAYYVQHGVTATERQAAQMRTDVLRWSQTTDGQTYYARHGAGELSQQPDDLPRVQAMWSEPRRWVTTEFLTCFGGMMGEQTNVFLISRSLSLDGSVHCGLRLVTNGGLLIKTDDANCCCIYFQFKNPEQVGHFEPVRDNRGRHRWAVDDEIVQQCLWKAMLKTKVARSVRDMRQKQQVAALNRINSSNETFDVGDLAWLIVPPEVVNIVTVKLQKRNQKFRAGDGKLLVKIGRIIIQDAVAGEAPLTTQQFVVWTEDGRLESAYSIDQLKLCHPPPEASLYRVVDIVIPTEEEEKLARTGRSKKKKLTLPYAYLRHITLLSTREAIEQTIAATQVAISLNSTLTGGVDAVPLSPSSSPPPVPPSYPCTHCGVTVTHEDCSFCFFDPCRAPFHRPDKGGCRRSDRVWRSEELLLFCSKNCLQRDRGVGNEPTRRARKR